MADIVFIAVTLGFFGLCALYIRGCERIIRNTEDAGPSSTSEVAE